jgi:hypothetical protein
VILDSNLIKKKVRFYRLIVAKSFFRIIRVYLKSSPLGIRSKLYFMIILFLANQENFMVSLPKFEKLIKRFLISKGSSYFDINRDLSVYFTGWRTNKKIKFFYEIDDQVQCLKFSRQNTLRSDVRRIHPSLTNFLGFKTVMISFREQSYKKIVIRTNGKENIFISGESNKESLRALNISFSPTKHLIKIDNSATIDGVFFHIRNKNPFAEALIFIVLNYKSLHSILLKYIPTDLLTNSFGDVGQFNKIKNIALFQYSLFAKFDKFNSHSIKQITLVTNAKSKINFSPSLHKIHSATMYPNNILVDSKNQLRNEVSLDPRYHFNAHISEHLYCANLSNPGALIFTDAQKIVTIKDSVIYVPCNPLMNWFHLMFEGILPLIFNLQNINYSDPLLINKKSPKQFKELLQFIGFNNFYELDNDKIYYLQSIVSFDSGARIVDSLANGSDLNDFSISQKALLSCQSFFQGKLNSLNLQEKVMFPKKLLVLRRGKTRGLINRQEIMTFCASKGFQVIFAENQTVLHQILFFSTAREIILEGGASMANLIFCRKGTRITFLCSEISAEYNLIFEICKLLDLELNVVAGISSNLFENHSTSIYDAFHSSYRVNPKLIYPFMNSTSYGNIN